MRAGAAGVLGKADPAVRQELTSRKLPISGRRGGAPVKEFETYRFPGKNGQEFGADVVVNSILTGPFADGCWVWRRAIPRELFSGGEVEANIVLATAVDEEYRSPIVCGTERLESKRVRQRPRNTLYDDYVGGDMAPKKNGAEMSTDRFNRPALVGEIRSWRSNPKSSKKTVRGESSGVVQERSRLKRRSWRVQRSETAGHPLNCSPVVTVLIAQGSFGPRRSADLRWIVLGCSSKCGKNLRRLGF
jgi:hypothetical protein